MTRFLLCLSAILAIGLLAPSRSWSDPVRPVFDVPEYENSGDDDEPHVEGPVILRPSPDRRAETIHAPRAPQTQDEHLGTARHWMKALFDRITMFLIRHHEVPRP